MIEVAILAIFPFCMAYAAASDLTSMTISNRLCLGLMVSFFALAYWTGLSWTDIAAHAAISLVVLIICFGMFAAGWIGGGDAKLAAATALWLGWGSLLSYLVIASVFGGILTLSILYWRGSPLPQCAMAWRWVLRLHDDKNGIPYGIALAMAGLCIYPETPLFLNAIS